MVATFPLSPAGVRANISAKTSAHEEKKCAHKIL